MAKKSMPKEFLVYVCDTLDDGTPVYAVANNAEDIPEEFSGQQVGVYYLNATYKFAVHRSLK